MILKYELNTKMFSYTKTKELNTIRETKIEISTPRLWSIWLSKFLSVSVEASSVCCRALLLVFESNPVACLESLNSVFEAISLSSLAGAVVSEVEIFVLLDMSLLYMSFSMKLFSFRTLEEVCVKFFGVLFSLFISLVKSLLTSDEAWDFFEDDESRISLLERISFMPMTSE